MNPRILSAILDEVTFTTSRASGPGGQNVNKVNSKVILKWDVAGSTAITEEQRTRINQSLKQYLTKDGALVMGEQASRSQLANKAAAIKKLEHLLTRAFAVRKKRKPTKPTKASVQKRMQNKKQHSEKKKWRQSPE